MIKKYDNVFCEKNIKDIIEYFEYIIDKDVWSSSIGWDQNLSLISSNTLTHEIKNNILVMKIKNSIEKILNINFDDKKLEFIPSIYVWSGGSYITWHSDSDYPYSGTIYLNQQWNSADGGVFLYKDNQTNEILGIEPQYNCMVVNSASKKDTHNVHCVTCIVPGTIKKRLTIQWRTNPKKEIKMCYQ
jgi:hypothetical protein